MIGNKKKNKQENMNEPLENQEKAGTVAEAGESNVTDAAEVADGAGDAKCTEESQATVESQIAQLKEMAESANDKYVRMAAEFDNYRRRTARERIELISTASEEVIKGLLPVIDDFERAIKVLKESKDMDAAIEGTELIYHKLISFLNSKGLSVIEALGKELDTEFHEAVAQFPTQDQENKNKIIDIVQQGYLLNGKVIRYAKVVVGV